MYAIYDPPYALSLPEAALRGRAQIGGPRSPTPHYLDKDGHATAGRRARRTGGRDRLRRAHQARHALRSRIPAFATDAQRCRYLYHALTAADHVRDPAHAVRLRRRAARAKLVADDYRLRPEAPRHAAHRDADLRHLFSEYVIGLKEPIGDLIRAEDDLKLREGPRRGESLDKPFLDFRQLASRRRRRARQIPPIASASRASTRSGSTG